MEKKLYRNEQHKVIGGVCAGLADYLNMDVSIIRVLFLLTFVFKGGGLLVYIIMWIAVPKRPYSSVIPGVDYVEEPGLTPGYTGTALPHRPSNLRYIVGFVLIIVGLMSLLNQFDLVPDIEFEYFWPALLIIVGVIFIFTSRHKTPVNSSTPFDTTPPKI